VSKPTSPEEISESKPPAKDSDIEMEARREAAEDLKLEALQDRLKDVEREARIERLEAGDDLLNEVNQDNSQGAVRADRDDRREKYTSAKVEKGWYVKPERTQRRILQKKLGSYRPDRNDPVPTKSHGGVVEGSLFDLHPLKKVRQRDVEATGAIRAAIAAPLPVKPVSPGLAEEPIPGRCWECYKPLRRRDRAGTKFCTDNMGECRKAYNSREADRAALKEIFKDWSDSQHGGRMLSIYRKGAAAMSRSAKRCGIKEGAFVATADGVLATNTKPLPPIEPQVSVRLEDGDGYRYHQVEIAAINVEGGTLFTFEMPCRPEGDAIDLRLSFEGDPGVEFIAEALPTRVSSLPPGAAMYAARNGRVAEYLAARKRDLAAQQENAKTDHLFNSTSDF
jgi:hypothetical protein